MQKSLFFIGLVLSFFAIQLEGCQLIKWSDIIQEMSDNGVLLENGLQLSEYCVETSNLEEATSQESEIRDRIYVKPECVSFFDNKIYLSTDSYYTTIENIYCDAYGYYFCAEGWMGWTCCKCGTLNSNRWNACSVCKRQKC